MIERLLGGRGMAVSVPQRGLTEFESRLARRLEEALEQELRKIWEDGMSGWEAEFAVEFAGCFGPMRVSVAPRAESSPAATVPGEAVLGRAILGLDELRNLGAGDVIVSNHPLFVPASLSFGPDERYGVWIGHRAGRRVVKIVRLAGDRGAPSPLRPMTTDTSGLP